MLHCNQYKTGSRRQLQLQMIIPLLALLFVSTVSAQRKEISLDKDWQTALVPQREWKKVNIPHNWDDYYGYRRLVHGNLHGEAMYKKEFVLRETKAGKRFFLFFEGAGSYASVLLNGQSVGSHAGGRTSFTLDITEQLKTDGSKNLLEVKIGHPAGIQDLPWVCGGCSEERGFSEGSQPFGIFRPVSLIITNELRIQPFGVHAWALQTTESWQLNSNNTLKNFSGKKRTIILQQELLDAAGKKIVVSEKELTLNPGTEELLPLSIQVKDPVLWSVENPCLYKIVTTIKEKGSVQDKLVTDFGFRTISWDSPGRQFLLNGKPVFINGIAEYEHLLGKSHAFSAQQVRARMNLVQAAGFNAFRDGHQPHNLLYGKLCNEKGILWWTQLSAHAWYDTKAFRENFRQLLKEWVIERRNDPSVILWGLQNESKLPKEFAEECTALIRSLDPTASTQRLVTTCNGGEGTDWDVPQNWTGTYGGDPAAYGSDLKKQRLVGEYGAWRSIDLHTEGGYSSGGPLSEDRMTALMEQKLRLAESVSDSVAGHFFWLLTSHDNPGRMQGGEGLRELDRVGPVNYKGLLTPWEEPTDAWYMFRSNYMPAAKEPMVYIASKTWPNRWLKPGVKGGIIVYSNCEEVELFNDMDGASLGRKKSGGRGTHFQWDQVPLRYNILYAVGYEKGKPVAADTLLLLHLPQAPQYKKLFSAAKNLLLPLPGYQYSYRVNCGGPTYKDENGHLWMADKEYAGSWTNDFPGLPAAFASQRRIFTPLANSRDWKLFQSFRYGREKLKYSFPVPDGKYLVELYFTEPWLGTNVIKQGRGLRIFDVAINGQTVLDDLDICGEAGARRVLKKTLPVTVSSGRIVISFPEIKAGQAVVSAIAIAKAGAGYKDKEDEVLQKSSNTGWQAWMDIGDLVFEKEKYVFHSLPSLLYGADWLQQQKKEDKINSTWTAKEAIQVYVAIANDLYLPILPRQFEKITEELVTDENGGRSYTVYRKLFAAGETIRLTWPPGYIIAWQPAGNLQTAFDLKPITQYRASLVKPGAGTSRDSVNGRYCVLVTTMQPAGVDYPVSTGVGDQYSFTVKYYYAKETVISGRLQLLGAGGTMMMDEPVNFSFTRPGKWNQFTVNTPGMINAGNYTLRIIVEGGEGLAVSGVDLQ